MVGGMAGGGPDSLCLCRDPERLRRLIREELLPELGPALRPVIREELQSALLLLGWTYPTLRIPSNQSQASTASCIRLHFNNELPEIIFTGNIMQSKDGMPLQVFIADVNNRKISSGPLSKAKIEFLVLDDNFDDEECSGWTEEEFSKHILHERKGRLPLLKGNCFVTLEGGVGNLGHVSFTDNSKWTRTQKFRLAARVLHNDLVEESIQAAISGAFIVNDHRGEYTMKHLIPSLEDEVWRLKNIRKDGPYHNRLVQHGIKTVQDFLRFLVMDQDRLCMILFGKKITNKKWSTILQHAWKCDLGNRCYSYIVPGDKVELALNSVFQVIAARFGERWQPLAQLPAPQQNLVDKLKNIAYSHQNDMVEISEAASCLSSLSCLPPAASPSEAIPSHLCHTDNQTSETDVLADCWDPSFAVCNDNLSHVEGGEQPCFSMKNYKMGGVSDQEASSAMQSCNVDEVPHHNTEDYGTASCSNMFMGNQMSRNHPTIRVSHSKWVKVRFTFKLRTLIRRMSARRNARTRQIKSFRLLLHAFRFGKSIRMRANARKMESLLRNTEFWSHEFSPQPSTYDYGLWHPQEDNYP